MLLVLVRDLLFLSRIRPVAERMRPPATYLRDPTGLLAALPAQIAGPRDTSGPGELTGHDEPTGLGEPTGSGTTSGPGEPSGFAKSSGSTVVGSGEPAGPVRVVLDCNLPGAIEAVAAARSAGRQFVALGFVSHVDAHTIALARAAGVQRVLARSAFFADVAASLAWRPDSL